MTLYAKNGKVCDICKFNNHPWCPVTPPMKDGDVWISCIHGIENTKQAPLEKIKVEKNGI